MLAVALLSAGCYGGEGTLGGACEREEDCGGSQSCERGVCSLCGDGVAQAGELCLDDLRPTQAMGASSQTPALADLDGDGREDVLWTVDGGLAMATQASDGLSAATTIPFDATELWTGEPFGDGATMVLVRDAAGGAALWMPRLEGDWSRSELDLEALRGVRDAVLELQLGLVGVTDTQVVRFSAPQADATVIALPQPASRISGHADIDGNGTQEVLLLLDTAELAWVDLGQTGEEAFAPLELGRTIRDAHVVQINADGIADLVVLDDQGLVSVWLADGQGGVAESVSRGLPRSTTSLLIADVTLDGQLDVLGYGPQNDGVRLSIRRGSTFDASTVVAEGGWRWVAPVTVGIDPFVDLLLFDGETFSFAARQP